MGNIMKINIYAERNKINGRILNIKKLEETIIVGYKRTIERTE